MNASKRFSESNLNMMASIARQKIIYNRKKSQLSSEIKLSDMTSSRSRLSILSG